VRDWFFSATGHRHPLASTMRYYTGDRGTLVDR